MNPNEKGMGSQALLYQAKMETEYTKLLEQFKDPKVAYQKLNELIDAAKDPNKVSLDNPFRSETRANNRLYFLILSQLLIVSQCVKLLIML